MFHKENPDYNRNQVGFYSLDELVPKDHLLRQIDEAIDFSFIYDLVKDSYCADNGRPRFGSGHVSKNPHDSMSLWHSFHASNHQGH